MNDLEIDELINNLTKLIQDEKDEKFLEMLKNSLIELKSIRAKLNKYSNVVLMKDYKTKGVPKLGYGLSDNKYSNNHLRCSFEEREFKELDNPYGDQLQGKYSALWSYCQSKIIITTETEVSFLFFLLMSDVLSLCGLEKQLDIKHEFSFTSNLIFRSGILIITHDGIPKGVIKLESPCEEFSDKSYSQLIDYMLFIHHMHGVSNVFGIISCYFKTRIVWLDGNKLFETEKVEELPNISISKLNSPLLHQIQVVTKHKVGHQNNSVSLQHDNNTKEIKRSLFVSPEIIYTDLVSNNESKLIRSLCSVVKKMYHHDTSSNIDQSIQLNNVFMEFTENSFNLVTLNKISFGEDVSKVYAIKDIGKKENFKKIYLISELVEGSGDIGKAWLAINTQAKAFVIKFFQTPNDTLVCAQNESKHWFNIWGIKTLVLKFNNEHCLLMPFFKPITTVDYNDKSSFDNKLLDACRQFSNSGYLISDLSFRHVGNYKEKFIFFDLGLVEIIKDNSKKEEAANKMFNNVINSIKEEKENENEKIKRIKLN